MKMRFGTLAAVVVAAAVALTGCVGSPGTASATANDADIMFASMMIDHHAQAIDMSDVLLEKDDVDPHITELAEQIKAAQQPEIEQLEGWLEDWNAETHDMSGMGHGDGMMTAEDMDALEAATGADAARLFLVQMIEHHEGAIDMAQDEVENGRDPGAIGLAEEIIAAQTAEIATMTSLLEEE